MLVTESIQALRESVAKAKREGKKVGFVPTMGNLHAGHLSLVDIARQSCDFIVCSIYVNPMQFGPNEDFDAYPRTLQDDLDKLNEKHVDLVFTPNDSVMYPQGKAAQTTVSAPEITNILCGASRPGHFDGVTTVVCKLFNMVLPDVAVFGEKDYQQLQVIKKMVTDLNIPVKIIGAPIAREANGLAMSSRNQYLTEEQRSSAEALSQALLQMKMLLQKQEQDYRQIEQNTKADLSEKGFDVDYLEIRHRHGLQLAHSEDGEKQLIVLAAAFYGKPRLLDNLFIDLNQ